MTMRASTTIDMRTLPRLASWAAADPEFTAFTWLAAEADVEMAIAFTALFWPDLVEHDGCVFLREFFAPDVYEEWKRELAPDSGAIERVMNHCHVSDLLPGGDRVGFSNLQHLGQVLAATWRARLASAYPDRHFEVTCTDDPENEEVVITFWQSQAGAAK